MKTSDIRGMWVHNQALSDSSAMWDAKADHFGDIPIPGDDHPLIRAILENACLGNDKTVLDIGCGAGTYSLSLADRVSSVLGLDLSPCMVSLASSKAASMGITNARYEVFDWFSGDVDGIGDGFDIVIAHMTPAISSYNSFMRMYGLVKESCFITRTVCRGDQVRKHICDSLGLEMPDASRDMSFMINLLWNLGEEPRIDYESRPYESVVEANVFAETCIREFKDQLDPSNVSETDVADAVKELSEDGIIHLEGKWHVATLYFCR